MKEMKPLPFFVYGTLLPDQPNFYQWQEAVIDIQPATLPNAILYDMGSYPMLIEQDSGFVTGAVVEIAPTHYTAILKRIDELENYFPNDEAQSMYLRRTRTVIKTDGSSCEAMVYIGQPQYVFALEPIGADWVAYTRDTMGEILKRWEKFNLDGGGDLTILQN